MLLNLDVSATAFYQAQSVLDFTRKVLNKYGKLDLNHGLSESEHMKLEKSIRGLKVQTIHRVEYPRKFRVVGVTKTCSAKTFFPIQWKTNEYCEIISVANYFDIAYKIQLRYPSLPCLKVGNTNKSIYLPFEVCNIVAGQRHIKKLSEQQTAEMIKVTCETPEKRREKILQGVSY